MLEIEIVSPENTNSLEMLVTSNFPIVLQNNSLINDIVDILDYIETTLYSNVSSCLVNSPTKTY